MATRGLGTLTLDLIARVGGFERGMDRAARHTDRRMRDMKRSAKQLATAMTAAFSAAVATAGIQIRNVLNQADEIGKMSEKIGLSVQSLSGLRYAAELSGTNLNTFSNAIQRLNVNLTEASRGTGQAQDAFRALGISVRDAEGNLRGNESILRDVADRFSRMEDGAEKTALAMRMFGRAGAELIPLLNQGTEGLDAMHAEAERLGIVMTQDLTDAAQRVNDNFTRLGAIWRGAWVQAVEASIGTFEELQQVLLDPTTRQAIESLVNGLVSGFTRVAASISNAVNFMRWFGEELAAQRFGPAADDIVRQQQLLDVIENQLEAMERKRDSWRSVVPWVGSEIERRYEELKAERDRIVGLIEMYQNLGRPDATASLPPIEVVATFEPLDLFDATEDTQKSLRDSIERTIAALQREAATFDLSRAEVVDYDLALLGATESQREMARALAEEIEARQRHIRLKSRGKQAYEETRTPAEVLSGRIEELNELLDAGAVSWDTYARAIFEAQERFDDMRGATQEVGDDVSRLSNLGADLGMAFSSAFENAIISGNRFRDVLKGIMDDLVRIAVRTAITEPLARASADFFGEIFPKRASGGPVMGGRGYIVGEHGPELFVPPTPGTIVSTSNVNVVTPTLSYAVERIPEVSVVTPALSYVAESIPEVNVVTPALSYAVESIPEVNVVTPSLAEAVGKSPDVNINVVNNAGAEVSARRVDTPHGPSIEVLIDRAVAQKLADRGSASNMAMRTAFGARPMLSGR